MWLRIFTLVFVSHVIHGQLNFGGVELPLTNRLLGVIAPEKKCEPSETMLTNGVHPCKGDVIFEDQFGETFINKNKWIVERYTPITSGAPDYEFVSYEGTDDTLFINNGTLIISPVAKNEDNLVRGTLDLRDRCTSPIEDQCYIQQVGAVILPPVRSAKITTKFSFTYGKIQIKAKLPIGDWIYPQIQLVPTRGKLKSGPKMWVAYSRGNSYYIGPNGNIGSTLLFGGLVFDATEPERSRLASKRHSVTPYGDDTNTYTLIWQPEKITAMFNNETYGTYRIDQTDSRFSDLTNEFSLSIGVGVGGINDFPDNYTSNNPKPWLNMESKQSKKFFDARNTWLPTWKKRRIQLQIDSVKILAV